VVRRMVWLYSMVVALALLVPLRAFAVDWYTDRAAWQSAVGVWADVDIAGQVDPEEVLYAGDPLALPYDETLTFDKDLDGRQNPGEYHGSPECWWSEWEGDPRVLACIDYDRVHSYGPLVGTFGGDAVWAFALEAQDFYYSPPEHEITVLLSDGSELSQISLMGEPGSDGYAAFLGWVGGSNTWFQINSDTDEFAIARMMKAEGPGAVPELPPFALAALGLLPLGLKLRRRRK